LQVERITKGNKEMNIFKEFNDADALPFEKLMKRVIAINVVCFIACAVVIYMEYV
tara:strand:- start:292 stop:456 length:165 start_codon:yes stop_codon:yes gene_type:complete